MTGLSTVLGTLPLALSTGAGAESRLSLGVAVIGGMLVGGVLTLFVIPGVYAIIGGASQYPESKDMPLFGEDAGVAGSAAART